LNPPAGPRALRRYATKGRPTLAQLLGFEHPSRDSLSQLELTIVPTFATVRSSILTRRSYMCRWLVGGVAVAILGVAAVASADNKPFGEAADLKPCATNDGFARMNSWGAEAIKDYGVPPECVAEVEKRAKVCLTDPDMKKDIDNPKLSAHSAPERYCTEMAVHGMQEQLAVYNEQQKKAKADADSKAKMASQKMPKADMHDAKLEKMIADAYKKNFPDNKILKVIITDKKWDFEKDALNRVTGRDINASVVNKHPDGACEIHSEMWVQQGSGKSFHGPFDERGAGSLEKVGILCENVK
jgi:hypothetical protein